MKIIHNHKGEIKIPKRCGMEIQIHGPSFKMSNYSAFELVGRNSQPSHMKIPFSDENVNLIKKKRNPYFYSHNIQILYTKINKLWGWKKKKCAMRTSCVFFGPNWFYMRNKCHSEHRSLCLNHGPKLCGLVNNIVLCCCLYLQVLVEVRNSQPSIIYIV
jgi:hypothetical protein